jgi:hypothetical protein
MVSEERDGLRKIRRLRLGLWILILAYFPIVWIAMRLIRSRLAIAPLLIVWAAGWVHLAARAAFSQCPRCHNCFHATPGTPSFWNLLAHRCTHCGLGLRADRVIYPGMR